MEIRKAFAEFMTASELNDAPIDQRLEMRRAFFAGAWLMYNLAFDPKMLGKSPEQINEIMDRYENEMVQFNEDVKAGGQ